MEYSNYECHSDIPFSLLWLKWHSAKVKSEGSTKLQQLQKLGSYHLPSVFRSSVFETFCMYLCWQFNTQVTKEGGWVPRDPTSVFLRSLLLARAILPSLFFVIVALVIALLCAKIIAIDVNKLAYFGTRQNTILSVKSPRVKISKFCFSYVFLLMTCYCEPNFVDISLRESVFSIFVVLRNHSKGNSVKWLPFRNGTLFSTFHR